MKFLGYFLAWTGKETVRRFSLAGGWMLLPLLAAASVSTTVSWNPSTDPAVTGYNIYYGTESHNYANMIAVGNVASATIDNLSAGTTYYFAAKARDDAGDESDFSNEAIFADYNLTPDGSLNLSMSLPSLANDQVAFSLAPGTPAGVSINPTNGVLTWIPGVAAASSVNNISVIIDDLTNPDASTQIAVTVNVSDFLNLALPSVPVQTGQSASLPLTLAASDRTTNLSFLVNWPGDQLLNPTLIFSAPIAGGTLVNQGTNLLVQLWTANGDALTGSNQIAQIQFQAAAGLTSAFISVPVSVMAVAKTDGSTFTNINSEPGEVVVVGVNPLLRPQTDANQHRKLTLYAHPGTNYQLQQSSDLSSTANWQPVSEYQPTSVEQTVNVDSANPIAFYRLMQE